MLCYTIKNRDGGIGGTYSGRFSFLHCATEEDRQRFVELRDRSQLKGAAHLIDPNDSSKKEASWPKVLLHELLHKRVYERSGPGLLLNGWRSVVRVRFLFLNDEKTVRKYYAARTIYFRETYKLHEEIVHELEGMLKKNPSEIDNISQIIAESYLDQIISADQEVLRRWKDERLNPIFHERIVSSWLGKKFNQHFAIFLSFFDKNGQIQRQTISDGGVVNDVFDERTDEPARSKTTKKLLRRIILKPTHGMEGFQSNLRWAQISARTQQQTLQRIYGVTPEEFYDEVVDKVCDFILRWSGVPTISQESYSFFIQDLVNLERSAVEKRWGNRLEKWSTDPVFRGFVNYFYLHGN